MSEPYDENNLFQAIPFDAEVVTIHARAGDRAQAALDNPVVHAVLRDLVGMRKEWFELVDDKGGDQSVSDGLLAWAGFSEAGKPRLAEMAATLARDKTVIGLRAPEFTEHRYPSLFLASHVGADMKVMQLAANLGFEQGPRYTGVTIHEYKTADTTTHFPIRLALLDGLLLLAVTPAPDGIHDMIDAYFGKRAAMHPAGQARRQGFNWSDSGRIHDRAIFQFEGLGTGRAWADQIDSENIDFTIETPLPPDATVTNWTPHLPFLSRLYDTNTIAVALTNPAIASELIQNLPGIRFPRWVELIKRPMSLALLGGEATRKFRVMVLNVPYPSLLGAVPVQSEADANQFLEGLLNAWGETEIDRTFDVDGVPINEIKTKLNKDRGLLTFKDRVAYALVDGHVLIASNGPTLERTIRDRNNNEHTPSPWVEVFRQAEDQTGFAWCDTVALEKSVGLTLSMFPKILSFSRRAEDKSLKTKLEGFHRLLKALAEREQVLVRETFEGENVRLRAVSGGLD